MFDMEMVFFVVVVEIWEICIFLMEVLNFEVEL